MLAFSFSSAGFVRERPPPRVLACPSTWFKIKNVLWAPCPIPLLANAVPVQLTALRWRAHSLVSSVPSAGERPLWSAQCLVLGTYAGLDPCFLPRMYSLVLPTAYCLGNAPCEATACCLGAR